MSIYLRERCSGQGAISEFPLRETLNLSLQ